MSIFGHFYILALAIAVLLTLALSMVGIYRRDVAGVGFFVGLLWSVAIYSFGSIFEIQSQTVGQIHFWLCVEYFGIATMGPLWFLLSRVLAGKWRPESRKTVPFLFLLPTLILILAWTNDFHHMFYADIAIENRGGFSVAVTEKGPFYWVNMAYMNACILAGTVTALIRMLRSPGIYRIHAAITFFASLFPWLGMLAYQLGLSPYGLDVAPFGVALSGAIYGWGLFRFRLFDLSPVVHENVFEGMRDGVMVFDTKLRLIGVNPSMKSIFPEIDPERIGEEAGQLLKAHPEILALLADSAQGRGGPRSVDVQIGGGGRAGHYEADTSDMVDRRGRKLGVILTMTDISARIELLGRVNQLASMDPLTGARNRRSFLELAGREFDRAKRYGSPLAFVILDLDHFKSVNDTYGHQMGDKVLAAAAAACESQLRSSDLFCRFGGEEFLALLPGSLAEAAAYIAERLRSAVSELSFELPGGGVLKISASLGLSCRDTLKDESFDDLLGEADRALYRAKDSGRDRVVAFSE